MFTINESKSIRRNNKLKVHYLICIKSLVSICVSKSIMVQTSLVPLCSLLIFFRKFCSSTVFCLYNLFSTVLQFSCLCNLAIHLHSFCFNSILSLIIRVLSWLISKSLTLLRSLAISSNPIGSCLIFWFRDFHCKERFLDIVT